ncbi:MULTISPECIES: ParA family protein [Arthrobacter]|uniref:ParA family protein n=2 Tax=Arthrobacter TaxID=1663 RepID=A0ABU9KJZ3_9MICC|nr:ParA family protein [Arthrobacter sp. YJM1]MDP5226228.1 ParA family protein [Arthrobacter sp. YJM1]
MRVVSVSSLKGGVGKTSVTTGLASAALAAGVPTLVVDLDPHADASTALGAHAGDVTDIGRLLKNARRARLAGNLTPSAWTTGPGQLDVAIGSAYTGIYDRPDLGRRDLRRLKNLLAPVTGYELVLIDCPPSLNGLTRMAWHASDDVILVAEPGLFSVAGTERTLRAIDMFRREFSPALNPAGIVANRVRVGSSEHVYRLEEMRSMFGRLLLEPVVPELANWQQIQGAAHAVHQWPGDSAKGVATVYDKLLAGIRQA